MCSPLLTSVMLLPSHGAYDLQVHAELFDWSSPSSQASYDVALACDVLYEPYSVEPIANITPQLLNSQTGQLLLADPSHRTKHNRYLPCCHAFS